MDHGEALYALAAACGVGICEACDRAGIARSTPPRWRRGTHARPQQVVALRRAILAIAEERGSLPAGAAESGFVPAGVTAADMLVDAQTIAAAAQRIIAALGNSGQA